MSTAPCSKTRGFMESGSPNQFEWILAQYDECLRLKANSKSQKPENIIKLDKWYQNELPKKLKSRGKEAHLTHEELVSTIKWKLARGKFRPNLTNLVQMNTPRVARVETQKAFRKIAKTGDVQGAIQSLSNLKGVGPAMASAILAAGAPHIAPYMADEVLLALPDTDGLDYTMKEYMRLVEHVNLCMERLNAQGGEFTPHKVELCVWSYFIANDLKPEILDDMPEKTKAGAPAAPVAEKETEQKPEEATNGEEKNGSNGESSDSVVGTEEDSNMSSVLDESSRSSLPAEQENGSKKEETNGKSQEVEVAKPVEEASNGKSSEESKENGNGAIIPSKTADMDEDTSDSTKENVEQVSPSSLKRPAAAAVEGSEDANDATPVAAANSAVSEADSEPAAKKLKPEEAAAPATLTA